MASSFLVSTLVVAIAEIGDKTQIATVVLAALGVLALSGVSL